MHVFTCVLYVVCACVVSVHVLYVVCARVVCCVCTWSMLCVHVEYVVCAHVVCVRVLYVVCARVIFSESRKKHYKGRTRRIKSIPILKKITSTGMLVSCRNFLFSKAKLHHSI